MVSRRKILSQSRDELNFRSHEEEEDTWYNKDKLYKVNCNEWCFSHCDLRSDWTMRKIQLSPNPSLCEITFYCHTMANCTLNPKSRQRVHRTNYCQLCVFQISDIIVDLQCHIVTMWHLRKVVVSGEAMLHDDVWDDVMSLKRIPPGRGSPAVLPIITQFNWQLASCSTSAVIPRSGSGPSSHWHSPRTPLSVSLAAIPW